MSNNKKGLKKEEKKIKMEYTDNKYTSINN